MSKERLKKLEQEIDYIYVIQAPLGAKPKVDELRRALIQARESSKDYAKVNEEHPDTLTIYVRRSKAIRDRLRQHFNNAGPGTTYALHMGRWGTHVNVELTISIMEFRNLPNQDLLVQSLEDGVWDYLKPAFGRRGAK